jgi:NAD(P)-dependent dehydrogenase (short-subunit alcohol dehydrogenase family)
MAKYTFPHLSRGSAIINNASINAYIGRPDLLDYTSTKGAIISFTRGLPNQYVGRDIRVNTVAPGPVWAPLIPATITDKSAQELHRRWVGPPSRVRLRPALYSWRAWTVRRFRVRRFIRGG